jgi:hypothetical protein
VVTEIAPANVLHGAVRLHGGVPLALASSPTPETQVREAVAAKVVAGIASTTKTAAIAVKSHVPFLRCPNVALRAAPHRGGDGRRSSEEMQTVAPAVRYVRTREPYQAPVGG